MVQRIAILVAVMATLSTLAWAQTGRLEAGDEQLETGEYVDVLERELSAGIPVQVTLTSSEFDVFLVIVDPAGEGFQVDDSAGEGLNVRETYTPSVTGTHLIAVTSARAGEVGTYQLSIASAAAPTNPLAPTPTTTFAGRYAGDDLVLELTGGPAAYRGTLTFQGQSMPVRAEADGSVLTGTFESGGASFAFTAELAGADLALETGGARYLLARDGEPGGPERAEPAPATPDAVATAGGFPPLTPPARGAARPAPPLENPGPGYATGYVRTRDGRPLPGVEVRIEGQNMAGGIIGAYPTTDAEGRYLTRVPDGLVDVNAYVQVDFRGERYFIRLAPDEGTYSQEFDTSLTGIVRNFTWRFDGLRPGADPANGASYYGGFGTIEVGSSRCCVEEHTIPEGSSVRVTLTPEGPLMDGSQGETIVLGCDACVAPVVALSAYFNRGVVEFREIPAGVYRATASIRTPDGAVRPVRIETNAVPANHASEVPGGLQPSTLLYFPPEVLVLGEPGIGRADIFIND